MGVGVIPEPHPDHNQILVGIHKKYLPPDTHCIVARELRFIGSDATGIVPAEGHPPPRPSDQALLSGPWRTLLRDYAGRIALWKKVLTDAVASGEIGPQQDLDTVAATFQSLFYDYSFHAAVGKSFDPTDLQAQMAGFYQSLCN